MQEHSAGTVVIKDSKYLLLHYDSGHWDFAKGHLESGETPEQAALRELKEETGIEDAEVLPGFVEKIKYFFKREGKTVAKEVIFFIARAKTDKVKLSFEHKDYVCLPFKEAVEKLTFNTAREVLRKADAFLKNVEK